MRTLRANRIQNALVLVDGGGLEKANQSLSGEELLRGNTYSTSPIYSKGAFHPKIMFLAGEKNGLLLIGSGNLTSSGLSTNDEIWAAFHLDSTDNENAFLFGSAWNYLDKIGANLYGGNKQKLRWIKQFSPWVKDLPIDKSKGILKHSGIEVEFLANTRERSIFSQLRNSIPSESIAELTVVSPYYDKQGQLLQDLYTQYQPSTMRCCVDSKSELLPHKLTDEWKQRIRFMEWSEVKKDVNELHNRLHAKLVHFKTSFDKEYLLFGSANATIAGMGGLNAPAINDEVSLLLQRNGSSNWLNELGIDVKSANATTISTRSDRDKEENTGNSYPVRIDYTELDSTSLTVYLGKYSISNGQIVIEDKFGGILETIKVKVDATFIKVECNSEAAALGIRIYFRDEQNKRVSNYSIIHSFEALGRCNPDPTKAKLNKILTKADFEASDWADLLNIVNLSDFRTSSKQTTSSSSSSGKHSAANTSDDDSSKNYETTSKEEFNTQSEDDFDQKHNRSHSGSIYNFLAERGDHILDNDNFEESEEQKLASNPDSGGTGNQVTGSNTNESVDTEKIRQSVINYLNKVERHYNRKISLLEVKDNIEVSSIDIPAIQDLLIALELLRIFKDREYEIKEKGDAGEVTIKKKNFKNGELGDGNDTLKGAVLNLVGKFLFIRSRVEFEVNLSTENTKLLHDLRVSAFKKALFLIREVQWHRIEELNLRKLLILNLLEYLAPDASTIELSKIKGASNDLLREQTEQLFEDYLSWKKAYLNPDQNSNELQRRIYQNTRHRFLFHSSFGGFVYLNEVIRMKPRIEVELTHPGFHRKNHFTMKHRFFVNMIQFHG
ncbi:MAG: hypothetical protein JJ895_05015 [Balneolaceae bacterium]|nr:hypothetical protein [Balneolaceae bacterium]